MSVTFSTCYYEIKSKFDVATYKTWLDNFLLHTSAFVVVYTDMKSLVHLPENLNSNIKVVIKELSEFYNYKYKENWIKNNTRNMLLNYVSWELQMLWAEKVHFVYKTMTKNYFNTEWFGWCDIGYFRESPVEYNWGLYVDKEQFSEDFVYYGCVNNDSNYIKMLTQLVKDTDTHGLPKISIPNNQVSIAGGFFICSHKKVEYWAKLYDDTLQKYFAHDRLVKDDQIIIINCILMNENLFKMMYENKGYNNWFMFRRFLMSTPGDREHNVNYYTPLVSVVIPTYNRYELLKKSIESVLNNTYKHVEIIVINDRSTDERYYDGELEKYEKTKVLHLNVNQRIKYNALSAQGKTRQYGVNIAKGEWICFLDDDDLFYKNKIETQLRVLRETNLMMCSSDMTKINYNETGDMIEQGLYLNNDDLPNIFSLETISKTNFINNSAVIIHRSILKQCGEFNLGNYEDYDMWLRALKYTNCAYIKEPLVYYFINPVKNYVCVLN